MAQPTSPPSSQAARIGRFLRSPMFPIFMIVFVDMLGLGITLPVLPLYAQGEFRASASQIALLASVYFGAQFVASPQLGRLSDRIGRRPVLIVSQAGTFAALMVSGLATALPVLYVARVVDGLTGGNVSVAQAYLSDVTDEKNRARGMGIINAAFGSGFLFGPAFGGLMAAQFGPRVPFFMAAAVSLVTITLSIFLLRESRPAGRGAPAAASAGALPPASRWSLLRQPGVALIMGIAFGGQFAFFSFQSTWVLWAERVIFAGRSAQFIQQAVGAIFTLVGLFGIATQLWLVGPLVRRFGEPPMVVGGIAARAFAWAVMALVSSIIPMLAVIPLVAVGGGVSQPALVALLTYGLPAEQRGHGIGLLESIQGLGRITGPILAGLLFQRVSPSAPMALAALLSGAAAIAAAGLWRVSRPARSQTAA